MASKKKDDLTFSIKVKAPKEFTEIVTDKKSGKKSGLLNACANALAEGIEKSNLKEQVRQAAGKAISAELKEKGKEAEKRLEALRASKPKNNKNLVFTKHIEWDEHHKSGPVSANIDTGAMKQKKGEKTRVNTAAKLFYEIVSKTPVDEDYDYTRPAKNNVYGKKFFKLEKNKNGKMQVVRADRFRGDSLAHHKADTNVTRNNWVLKLTTNHGTVELKAAECGVDFSFGSEIGWIEIASLIRERIGRYKLQFVEVENKDPYIDVLEYGRYGTTSTERHKGDKYDHGTVSGYSVQAPRGIMRVAASQLNNLQLEAENEGSGVISEKQLEAMPKITLQLNSDNNEAYNKSIVENEEYIKKLQWFMDEIKKSNLSMNESDWSIEFLIGLKTAEVNVRDSKEAAKSRNDIYFKMQEKEANKALAEAIEKEIKKQERRISQMAKQIAADARKERRRVSVGEFNRGLRGAEESFFNAEKITEQREGFTVTMKSPKTNISKNMQEKSVAKVNKYAITDLVRQTYFMIMIPFADDVQTILVKRL